MNAIGLWYNASCYRLLKAPSVLNHTASKTLCPSPQTSYLAPSDGRNRCVKRNDNTCLTNLHCARNWLHPMPHLHEHPLLPLWHISDPRELFAFQLDALERRVVVPGYEEDIVSIQPLPCNKPSPIHPSYACPLTDGIVQLPSMRRHPLTFQCDKIPRLWRCRILCYCQNIPVALTDKVAELAPLANETDTHALRPLRCRQLEGPRQVPDFGFWDISQWENRSLQLRGLHLREVVCLVLVHVESAVECRVWGPLDAGVVALH